MKKYLSPIVVIISFITIVSGLTQVIAPEFILSFIGAEITSTSQHFFAIIGMFMTLFGGMMLHAVYSSNKNEAAVMWAALQKLGAAVAVGLGILHEIFNPISATVALFDLFSGILFIYYYTTIYRNR